MNVGKYQAQQAISRLLERIPHLKEFSEENMEFRSWQEEANTIVKSIFGEADSTFIEFHNALYPKYVPMPSGIDRVDYKSRYKNRLDLFESKLKAMKLAIDLCSDDEQKAGDAVSNLICILSRFHKFAKQLRHRYNGREQFVINDEYDVQDITRAILRLYFDDVRSEECTPSYAGGSSRMDFLIAEENIGIEIKKTRQGLKDRELGEQLMVDRDRYKNHHKCKYLICFIYDPDEFISNPAGLIKDLNGSWCGMGVHVVISPN